MDGATQVGCAVHPGHVPFEADVRLPARESLYATFRFAATDVAALRTDVDQAGKVEREFTVELVNAAGEVHATCQKLLSIRRRAATE